MEAEKDSNTGKVAELFVNTRVYSDGLSKEHKQSFISWLVAVTTLTIYTGWMHILLGLMLGSFFSRTCPYLLLAIWATTWLPAKPVMWSAFCSSWVFKTWREYFSFSYLNEAELELGKRYIFVEVPHGVFPLSEILAGTNCQAIWPHWKVYSLAASSVFGVPLWRHFLTWIGCVPATSANFKKMLGKGSVADIVGGIAEMYMQHPHKERIMLANRKGFVRVAVEEGLDGGSVPVYHFGNTQVFDFWPQSLSAFARKRRAAYDFLVGWWGTPVPRKEAPRPVSPTPSVEIVAVFSAGRVDYVNLVTPSTSAYSSGSEHSSAQEGERVSAHSSDYRVPSCPEGCGSFPGCGPNNTPSGAGAAAMCAAPADSGDEADSAGKQGQTLIIPVEAASVPEINMCSQCHVDADGGVHVGMLFSRHAFSAL